MQRFMVKHYRSNIKLQTINLIAEEARYHERCHNKFFLKINLKKVGKKHQRDIQEIMPCLITSANCANG